MPSSDLRSRLVKGSTNMTSVPNTLSRISGSRRRIWTLSGIVGGLQAGGARVELVGRGSRRFGILHPQLDGLEDPRRAGADARQECFGVDSHPNHHHDQGHGGGQLAPAEVEHTRGSLWRRLAEEDTL